MCLGLKWVKDKKHENYGIGIMTQPNSIFFHKNQSFKLLQTFCNLPPRLFHTSMSAIEHCRKLKRSTQGPHIGEDSCTFPVYLSLLVYMILSDPWLVVL